MWMFFFREGVKSLVRSGDYPNGEALTNGI